MKKVTFVLLFLYACTNHQVKNKNLQILPSFLHEGDSITINAIKDSIDIDIDSLFFHMNIYYQDLSHTQGYIKIENGKGKFKVPKNAAYIYGFFYNLNEAPDTKEYKRLVYDKNDKPVINAYQQEHGNEEEWLKKELLNHPDNLTAYATHITQLRHDAYYGRISDTLVIETAKKYLSIVTSKADLSKESDLYTLTTLYITVGDFQKAKKTLFDLSQFYPKSYLLRKSMTSLSFINKNTSQKGNMIEKGSIRLVDDFLDSLQLYIAKEHPYSPTGVWNSFLQNSTSTAPKYYNNGDRTKNLYFQLKNVDSTNINLLYFLIDVKKSENNLDSIKFIAEKYLKLTKENIHKHYHISSYKERGRSLVNEANDLSLAYNLVSQSREGLGDFEGAIIYSDSAWQISQTNTAPYFNYDKSLVWNKNNKSRLQRKNQQPFEALKTYSELYQEIQDERILDSIKVVFEEQDQVEDFKNYAQNLKNNTKNNTKEVKEELKTVPEFSIKDTKGNLYTDKNLKGAVVVLNFWGVHCSPCVREIPVMNEFWEATQGHEIVYLAITRDKALATERFGRRQKEMFEFPVVATNQEFFDTFGVQLIPTQIIINPKGEIIYTQVGATPNATQNLKKVLEKELQIDNILIE